MASAGRDDGRGVQTLPDERERPRVSLSEEGECLVVTVDGRRGEAAAIARTLPGEPGRVIVVMQEPTIAVMPELAREGRRWAPGEWESIRLVAPCAGAPTGSGRTPAQELAELLGVEVLAPDGMLLEVPGGSLYVMAAPGGPDSGVWMRFRPGRPPEPRGRRFPGPAWERDLTGFAEPAIPGVTVEEIPAGLWMRWAGVSSPDDLAFAVPAEHATMSLVVSR